MKPPKLQALHTEALAIENEVAAALGMVITARPGGTRWAAYCEVHDAPKPAALAARWRQGQALRWRIAASRMEDLHIRAARMRDADEVAGAALEHLFRAAVIWDPARGKFSTVARWWIRLGVTKAADSTCGAVSIAGEMRAARAMLRAHDRGQPAAELAAGRFSVADVNAARAFACVSLDAPIPGTDASQHALFADADAVPVDEAAAASLDVARLRAAIARLEKGHPREMQFLRAVYGIDCATTTHAALGERVGLCRERIRQITHRAGDRLRIELAVDAKQANGRI